MRRLELTWWMMASTRPMTVKTPPMMAHEEVRNLYAGMRVCCTTMEMGERSYWKAIEGYSVSGAANLFECTVNLYEIVSRGSYTCFCTRVTTLR